MGEHLLCKQGAVGSNPTVSMVCEGGGLVWADPLRGVPGCFQGKRGGEGPGLPDDPRIMRSPGVP